MHRYRLLFALCAFLPTGQTSAQDEVPQACTEAAYRQFDFWLGTWEVFGSKGDLVGHNDIVLTLNGCALEEHWRAMDGGTEGRSFSMFDGLNQRWVQYWIDNQGGTLNLSGNLNQGRMVLTGVRPSLTTREPELQRVSWYRIDWRTVVQRWEQSSDDGESWITTFEGTYRRIARGSK